MKRHLLTLTAAFALALLLGLALALPFLLGASSQSSAPASMAPADSPLASGVALPASGLMGVWQVGEYRVEAGPGTGIVGTPRVGAMVWVSGAPDYANIVQAQLVEVLGE